MKNWIKKLPWTIKIFLPFALLWTLIMFLLSSCTSHNGYLPDLDLSPLPTTCLVLPLKVNNQQLSPGWVDFGDVDGDGDMDFILSWWGNTLGYDETEKGWRKMIAVWLNEGVMKPPKLAWYIWWTEPQEYLSYKDYAEQGPLVAFRKGGESYVVYRYFDGDYYYLYLVEGKTGTRVRRIQVPLPSPWHKSVQDILVCPDGTITVCYRHNGKTVSYIECYKVPSLQKKWSYWLKHEGRYNPLWACHRCVVIRLQNGKYVVWFGCGFVDWNGKGRLNKDGRFQNNQIELLGMDRKEPFTFAEDDHHWDSMCWWPNNSQYPTIVATTESARMWRFPTITESCKSDSGPCYNEYVADYFFSGEGLKETHRLRNLNDNYFLMTNVYVTPHYQACIVDKETMQVVRKIKTIQEAEIISWSGLHDYYVLTDFGIFTPEGKKVADRKGPRPNKAENNFISDLFGTGSEQVGFYRKDPEGNWLLCFQANSKALRSRAIPPRTNASFY